MLDQAGVEGDMAKNGNMKQQWAKVRPRDIADNTDNWAEVVVLNNLVLRENLTDFLRDDRPVQCIPRQKGVATLRVRRGSTAEARFVPQDILGLPFVVHSSTVSSGDLINYKLESTDIGT
ncbi:MAG: hypothetical protein M1816_001015 [Peltula sp. TS41687]|nr:MAG: hypothetical protein M1816_001015 [Peltula sp. TS41687]